MTRVRRFLAGVLTLLMLVGTLPASVRAASEQVDQTQTTSDNVHSCEVGYACAQVFTAGKSGALTRARLQVATGTGTEDMTVEVRALSGVEPTGSTLATATVTHATVSGGTDGWVSVTFPQPAQVTAGTKYALFVSGTGTTDYNWSSQKADVYSGGEVWLQATDGTWGAHAFDFAFETYVTPTPSARLSALSLSVGSLSPTFTPGTTAYTVVVPNATTSLTVSTTTEDPAASVTVNGNAPNTAVSLSSGTTNINVVVTASDGVTSQTYTLAVSKNSLPTVTGLSDQTIQEDTSTGTLSYTVGDAETPDAITVTASSLSPSIVPDNGTGVSPGGSGTSRTIRVTPAPDATGTATIEVAVSDGIDTKYHTFKVTVTNVNDPPTISAIPNQSGTEDQPIAVNFTVTDPDGTTGLTITPKSSDQAILPDANLSVSGSGTSRTLTITPGSQGGTVTISLTVSDGVEQAVTSFSLTLTAVNDAPVITGLSNKTIPEDTNPFTFSFKVSDEESAASSIAVSVTSSNTALVPNTATVTNTNGDVTVSMSPAAEQVGTTTISVTASDGEKSTTSTFVLTIAEVNDPPVIAAIANQTGLEDNPIGPINVTISDADTPLSELALTAISSNQALVPDINLVLGGSGGSRTLTITPGSNQNGPVTITLRLTDGVNLTTRSFELMITPVNDPPTLSDIPDQSVAQGATIAPISFSVGDLETLPGSLTVSASSSNQTLVPNENLVPGGSGSARTLTITPAAGQAGTATITVSVRDGEAITSDTFILSISQAPTISTITGVTIEEDTPTDIIGFTISDAETPASSLTVTASSSNKALLPDANISLGGSGANRTIVLNPALNQNGQSTVTISVSDGTLTTTRSFTFTVTPVNDPPAITAIADLAVAEDEMTGPISITVSDPETAGGALMVTAVSNNQTLVPDSNIFQSGTGGIRAINIRPAQDLSGIATITVTVSDGLLTASRSFTLTVTSVNDAPNIYFPVASPAILEDTSGTIKVTATDPDSPTSSMNLTVTSLDQVKLPDSNIALSGSAGDWTLSVTPVANASGAVKLRITVTDGVTPATKDLTLNIVEVNDLPMLSSFADQTTDEDVSITGIVLTVGDLETPVGNLQLYGTSDNLNLANPGSFVFSGSGASRTLTITPRPDAHGMAIVTITVDDGTDKVSRNFTLTVNPVPDPPRLTGIGDKAIDEDTDLVLPVTIYAPDSPRLEDVQVTIASSNEELVPTSRIAFTGTGASRTLSLNPIPEASGTTLITFTLTDGVMTGTQTMLLTVNSVNDAPVVSIITDRAIFEDTSTGEVTFMVGDVELGADGLLVTGTSSNQAIVPDANIMIGGSGTTRTVTVIPAPDRTGRVTITVKVADGMATATESYLLTINPVNDAPSFTKGPNLVVDEDAGSQTFRDWATNISAGPFEVDQRVTFEVNTDNPSLFAVPPVLSPTGILSFTSQVNAYGTATVNVRLKDDGGLENNGVDTSAWQSFTITILPVNDPPEVSQIPAQGTEEGVPTKWLTFTVDDVESGPNSLWVTATSSDETIVRSQDIVVSGSGPDRQVKITPRDDKIGTVIITLTVHDGEKSTAMSFPLVINDLKLRDLTPETGAFAPVFDPHTLEYTLVYLGSRTDITLTPRADDPAVKITVNGIPTTSGQESHPIPLEDAGGRTQIVVSAPATGLSKTYSVRFVRALSKIATLADLSVTPGQLTPAFAPEVSAYKVVVDYYTTEVKVAARPGDGRARVEIQGGTNLMVGNNEIRIRVRAENGEERLYTVTVTRDAAPLSMSEVSVEPGSEWAQLRFNTPGGASAEVTFQEPGQQARTVRSGGEGHSVTLGPLKPNTTYSFRVVATRRDEHVDFSSSFSTATAESIGLCAGGDIAAGGPRTAEVSCPASFEAAKQAGQILTGQDLGELRAARFTDVEMQEAMRQAGITRRSEEPATVVVYTGTGGPLQAAVIETGAVARAARMGADVEIRSQLGSILLPTAAVASLASASGQLVVLFEEVDSSLAELAPFVSDGQLQRASAVVDVSVATLFDDGRLERHTRFATPVTLKLNVEPAMVATADRLGGFWLRENTAGKVVERVYVGGVIDDAAGTITMQRDHLSMYVALRFDHEFQDVPRTHWAFDVVHQMAARQVIRGKSATRFEPESPVTRAQFAAMLVRGLGLDKDTRFAYVYTDIRRGDVLAPEIGGAVMWGLMMGYPDGTFHPDAQLNRQELATVLYRLASRFNLTATVTGLDYQARLNSLKDWSEVAPWAQEAVRGAISQGLMNGRTPEAFSPNGIATRAEAATVVQRLIDMVQNAPNP